MAQLKFRPINLIFILYTFLYMYKHYLTLSLRGAKFSIKGHSDFAVTFVFVSDIQPISLQKPICIEGFVWRVNHALTF